MGFFKSTKGSIISDYFQLKENVAGFAKGSMYDLALYTSYLEITSLQKKKLRLNYDQITDVFYGIDSDLVEKPKSLISRAAIGGLLFGSTGALVGAISGTGTKTKKEYHIYLIISYIGSDGRNHFLQFEDTRKYKGDKLAKHLKDFAHVESKHIPDIQTL